MKNAGMNLAKKIKVAKELKYKKGLAIVMLRYEETASEYDSESRERVELHFKSLAAVKRACSTLGWKLPQKDTVDAYKRGKTKFIVSLNDRDLWQLDGQYNIRKEFYFIYKNHIL